MRNRIFQVLALIVGIVIICANLFPNLLPMRTSIHSFQGICGGLFLLLYGIGGTSIFSKILGQSDDNEHTLSDASKRYNDVVKRNRNLSAESPMAEQVPWPRRLIGPIAFVSMVVMWLYVYHIWIPEFSGKGYILVIIGCLSGAYLKSRAWEKRK